MGAGLGKCTNHPCRHAVFNHHPLGERVAGLGIRQDTARARVSALQVADVCCRGPAGAARQIIDTQPCRAGQAPGYIETVGRETLSGLRRM
ncbi:hypothetical protein FHR33_003287 [Nonomuraea dietziae]|uniref:Uncharacterized protein n=1 Tax=Nonomuraea dietziae TaxID=65515 RepID=A0A7W5VGM5_9ACTN|nr:hypothetical protein [Nonomuraea dietziae]